MAQTQAPWGNTRTGNSAVGPTVGNKSSVSAIVRNNGTLYENAFSIDDPVAYAADLSKEFDLLRSRSTIPGAIASQRSDWEYAQTLLRITKRSKGTGPLGSLDLKDVSAFKDILRQGYLEGNAWETVLENIARYGDNGDGTGKPKVSPYNPIYSKEISVALKLIDKGDAESILSDTYFKTFGQAPSSELIGSFKTAYSKEAERQKQTNTTESSVTYKPVLDAKGKPKFNKDGTPQMKATKKYNTVTNNEGFTEEEQKQFLADYIVKNSPKGAFDQATIAGAAKEFHDILIGSHALNYDEAPNMETLVPVIKSLLSATDKGVSDEILAQYQNQVRTRVGTRFMGIADFVKSGGDAKTVVDPLTKYLSGALESDITVNDKLAVKLLNFQGSDGKFRLPNQYEIDQAVKTDSRYGATAVAKNEAVNLYQSLKGAIKG